MPQTFVPSFLHHLLRSKNQDIGNLISPLFDYPSVQQIITNLHGNLGTQMRLRYCPCSPRTQINRMRDRTTLVQRINRSRDGWGLFFPSMKVSLPQASLFFFCCAKGETSIWTAQGCPLYDLKKKVSKEWQDECGLYPTFPLRSSQEDGPSRLFFQFDSQFVGYMPRLYSF